MSGSSRGERGKPIKSELTRANVVQASTKTDLQVHVGARLIFDSTAPGQRYTRVNVNIIQPIRPQKEIPQR